MIDDLKPCPFCGGEKIGTAPETIWTWSAFCKECTATMERTTEAEAVAAWNTRAAIAAHDSALLARAEAAEAKVAELESKLRCVISHATGGHFNDPSMGLNEICVRITEFRNKLWKHAQEKPEALVKALREALERVRPEVFDILRRHEVGEQCFAEVAMVTHDIARAARASTPAPASPDAVQAAERMRDALAKVMPIRVHDGSDYAEVYFGDSSPRHSTQAMTMNPQDWLDIQIAWDTLASTPVAPASPDEAEADEREALDVLSGLSSYLAAGPGDDATTAEQFGQRIRWGIDHMVRATIQRCAEAVEEMSKSPKATWGDVKRAIARIADLASTPAPSPRLLAERFEWAAPGDQQEDAWLVRFCDKDCGEAIFTGPDAEREAWEHWNRYAPSYNIYVFRLARLRPPAPASPDEGRGVEVSAAGCDDVATIIRRAMQEEFLSGGEWGSGRIAQRYRVADEAAARIAALASEDMK